MEDFKLPTLITPQQRTSSITNAFTNGLMPRISPSDDEINEALELFGQKRGDVLKCVYCGDSATEWDHFRPLINNKKPTGYITEIYNLVPCCHACNGSKGSKEWTKYLQSNSKRSARTRLAQQKKSHLIDCNGALYKNLKSFEQWSNGKLHRLCFEYDSAGAVCDIEVFEGNSRITHIDKDTMPSEIVKYYSTMIEINKSLNAMTQIGKDLRDTMAKYLNS